MVNIVLIGATSDIARRRHLAGLTQAKSANMYGFFARTAEKVVPLAEQYGVKAFTKLEDVWNDKKVDAVLICTPTPSHSEIAVAALCAGKHVLCEKAMAISTEQARAVADAVKESGKKFMMLHVQRRYAPHLEAKRLLDNGEIGKLLSYRTYLGVGGAPGFNHGAIPAWKNAVAELGSHRIDLMRYFTGSDMKRVFGFITDLNPAANGNVGDNCMVIAEHENGVIGQMHFARTSYNGNDRSTVLFGTEGSITIYAETHELVVEKKNRTRTVYQFPSAHEQSTLELTDLHELFCRCIEEDTKPVITARDGLACMCTIDAVQKSACTGTWVTVENPRSDD